ncbi:hypothetical protein [Actinomadura parmotrematis]|uniref:BMP family ABC transporter substrate-binding protein n=1 Tax=Actinomadura parmotrematis TaxID=2864039 RepID=A0ABS7FQ51_9ACTN|nr:hypothetical protein [Actinomadura parmotrematis]MBW8482522.1 hypothetical protein [Actinomadura parmotrematis]
MFISLTALRNSWRRLSPPWQTGSLVTAAIAVLVAAGLVIDTSSGGTPPRARQYSSFKACLLTDAQGIAGRDAAPVWTGMQKASLKTHAMVQYTAVAGPPTVANARTYLSGLVQRRCGVVLAVGKIPVETVMTVGRDFPAALFFAVGAGSGAGNVRAVGGTSGDVERAVAGAVGSGRRG